MNRAQRWTRRRLCQTDRPCRSQRVRRRVHRRAGAPVDIVATRKRRDDVPTKAQHLVARVWPLLRVHTRHLGPWKARWSAHDEPSTGVLPAAAPARGRGHGRLGGRPRCRRARADLVGPSRFAPFPTTRCHHTVDARPSRAYGRVGGAGGLRRALNGGSTVDGDARPASQRVPAETRAPQLHHLVTQRDHRFPILTRPGETSSS